MIYLTYNDSPSGIYSGQVLDVCDFLNKNLHSNIHVFSIISIRNFFRNRKKIKSEFPNAVIVPMFPKLRNWNLNFFSLYSLFFFFDAKTVIARGPFAACLALRLKKAGIVKYVCFDARGAYAAELNEYAVTNDQKIKKDIYRIEEKAVSNSDFRIAVSNKLVEYWRDKYGYEQGKHIVIPCTVNSRLSFTPTDEISIDSKRISLGFLKNDILFVYAGSSAGWQSMKLIDAFLLTHMERNQKIKVLFLTDKIPDNMQVVNQFGNRVTVKWVDNNQVFATLVCADYGLLLRENSVTNKVSAPVKFAEYLTSGLKVIISDSVGDYSDFVKTHDCGYIVNSLDEEISFSAISFLDRQKNVQLAANSFSKRCYLNEYSQALNLSRL